jgi:hypothetical protein
MDLFVVPTVSFRLLYGLLIMGHGRRQILWFGVTSTTPELKFSVHTPVIASSPRIDPRWK